jgi:hypothetical protein
LLQIKQSSASQADALAATKKNEAFITFFSPWVGIPPQTAANHCRLPLTKINLFNCMPGLLKVVEYEFPDRQVTVHLGWPLPSWGKRITMGLMVLQHEAPAPDILPGCISYPLFPKNSEPGGNAGGQWPAMRRRFPRSLIDAHPGNDKILELPWPAARWRRQANTLLPGD